MIDWKLEIVRVVYWKQIAHQHDPEHTLPWHFPEVAARPDRIAAAEQAAGASFPGQYKEFLGFADGWKGFHVNTDLFGTGDFLDGRSLRVLRRPDVQSFIRKAGLERVIPVGASDVDSDVFLLALDTSKVLPGGVVWFGDDEVDRYQSFHEFFASMVNYNAYIAKKMQEEHPDGR